MLIIYESDYEVIVVSKDKEHELFERGGFFAEDSGRNREDYDRLIVDGSMAIGATLRIEEN